MPNKRIDQLDPNLNSLTGFELIPIFDTSTNTTERITLNTLASFVDASTDTFVTGATFDNSTDTLILGTNNNGFVDVVINRYNRWFVPSGQTLTIPNGFQSFIYGDFLVEGTIDLQENGQLVVLNGDILLSGGTIIGSGTTYSIELPEFNTFVTSGTFDSNTKQITFNGNYGFIPFNVDLSSLSTDNFYNTGGTYNSLTKSIDFTGNDIVTDFSVDVSQLLDDTNTYTTGATLNGNTVEFNRNDLSNAYSVDLTPLKFTGNTISECISDIFVTNVNSCSPLHIQPTNNGDVYISEGGGNVGIGTNNPITTLDVNGSVNISNSLSATTFYGDGSNLVGLSTDNFYTTGATLNGNTLRFNRNDLNNAYSVDLSSLKTSVNYSNVAFVDAVNGNDSTGTINDFTKPFSTIPTAQSALVTSGQTNRGLIYVRRGTYTNLILNLTKGIDVYCEPGVVLTGTVAIRDNGVPVTSNFLGYAKITNFSTVEVFRITADSFINIEFDSIFSTGAAFGIYCPTINNQIIVKGNNIAGDTLGFGYINTIRDGSNVVMNISNRIESQHISVFTRRIAGNVVINAKQIVLKSGNIYGGNQKQVCLFGNSTANPGKITINADLISEDPTYYGGISAMIRLWESPNLNIEINGTINGGSTLGVAMSNGSSNMVINGDVISPLTTVYADGSSSLTLLNSNLSGTSTVVGTSGSARLNIKNCTLIRRTDTFSSPFTVGGSSTVYVNDSSYYSEFFGNLINIESNTASLYTKNFTAEGFIDLTGSTGSFINNGSANPKVGLINTISNRDNNTGLTTTYSSGFVVIPNLNVPKFF